MVRHVLEEWTYRLSLGIAKIQFYLNIATSFSSILSKKWSENRPHDPLVRVSRQDILPCTYNLFWTANSKDWQESCRSIYYISMCKDSTNQVKYQRNIVFSLYFRGAAYLRDISLKDNGTLSHIHNFPIFLRTHNSFSFLFISSIIQLSTVN